MYQKSLVAKAKIFDSELEVEGGVCKFNKPLALQEHDKDGEKEVYLILHPDFEGKPMVSKVEPSSIISSWSCWEWMDSWLKAYQEQNPNDFSMDKFKTWLNNQPMVSD